MATNIMGLVDYVQNKGELGKQQGQQSRLASLASQAYTTPAGQQNALLGQMAQVSPEFAQGQQKQFQQQGDDRARKAAGAAKYVLSAIERGDPAAIQGAYRTVYPYLAELVTSGGGQAPPEQWDPAMAEGMHQILAAAEGGGANSRVQSRFVGEDGQVYAMMADSPVPVATGIKADRQMWFRDHPGMAAPQLVGKDGQVQTVGQQSAPQGVPQSDGLTQFTDVNGRPVNFDAGVPANFREQMLANPEPFDSAPSGSTANLPHSIRTGQQQSMGGGVYARPSEAQTAAEVERAKLQAQMDALPQRGQIEAQNEAAKVAARQGVERIPAPVMKMIQDIEEKASTAGGIIARMSKHRQKIASGDLQFGPVSNVVAKGRNYAGQSTEQSRNFQLFMSDLEKMRNDSLRLNNGVQTEGDAQRAWNELYANLNDSEYVLAGLDRIDEINQRAAQLYRRQAGELRGEYGRGESLDHIPPMSDFTGQGGAVQRARNPQTGEVLELRNGQWVSAQ